jgi:hypothetical protein
MTLVSDIAGLVPEHLKLDAFPESYPPMTGNIRQVYLLVQAPYRLKR